MQTYLCRDEECRAVCFSTCANLLCNIVQGVHETQATIAQSIFKKGRYTSKH